MIRQKNEGLLTPKPSSGASRLSNQKDTLLSTAVTISVFWKVSDAAAANKSERSMAAKTLEQVHELLLGDTAYNWSNLLC